MVREPHRRRALLRHPLPWLELRDGRRAGPPRRERARPRRGLLRGRRVRREPRPPAPRVVGGPQRPRGLHAAHPGHRGGSRPARRDRGDLLRHGVVRRRAPPLLHRAGPRDEAPSGLATRARHEPDRRRARPPGGRRALQRRPRAHPQRRVDRDHRRVHDLHGRPRPPLDRCARRAPSRHAPPAGRGVPAGPLGRPLRHPHQPRRPGLQGGGRPVRGPGRRAVDRSGRPRGRPADQPGRGLRRPPGAARVGAGARAAPHHRRRRHRTGALLRRTRPLGRHRDEPGVRDHHRSGSGTNPW